MRFPEYNPPNLPKKEEEKFIPVEEDIVLARQALEAAKQKYEQTGDVLDKIDLTEAQTKIEFLEKEMNLDFTRTGAVEGVEVQEDYSTIEEKIAELKEKIESAKRGAELAKNLNDNERTAQMTQKREEFEDTLAMLTAQKKEKRKEEEVDAFTQAVRAADGGAIRKMEKRGF